MNKKFVLDKGVFRILYEKYKQYLLPIGILCISVVLINQLLIPQFNDFLSTKEEEDEYRQSNEILRNNLNFLTNLDTTVLGEQVGIVSTALPVDKDFEGVLTSISSAAVATNVSLDDFTFNVGELSSGSATLTKERLPTIRINLTLRGTVPAIKEYINNVSKRFPLIEISKLESSSGITTATVSFYYRPFSTVTINEKAPIQPLSQSQIELINTLLEWQKESPIFTSSLSQEELEAQLPALINPSENIEVEVIEEASPSAPIVSITP